KYGSQGQQRTAAISLKLSQIEIYKESTGDYPVVLLDDILSELDDRRQRNILSILGKTQAFITCTDPGFIENYSEYPSRVIEIVDGKQNKELIVEG
ncbi:MAG: DNA replication and repair protein RecF, partial [Eubacterium sp.]